MATSSLPSASTLPSLPESERTHVLDLLFEPCPTLHAVALDVTLQTHASFDALIDAIHGLLSDLASGSSESDRNRLDAILGAHPRLGAAKVDSAQSRAEQAQLQQGSEVPGEAERLANLNQEYEEAFPGLKYVVFVNGRGRDVIMQDMQRRIERGDIHMERREGIQAMCDIAKDRAKKLQVA